VYSLEKFPPVPVHPKRNINLDFTKGDVEDIIGGLESLFGSI
jgi:hypothetical protein